MSALVCFLSMLFIYWEIQNVKHLGKGFVLAKVIFEMCTFQTFTLTAVSEDTGLCIAGRNALQMSSSKS